MQRSTEFALLAAVFAFVCYLVVPDLALTQGGPGPTVTHDISGFIRVGDSPGPAGILVRLRQYDGGGERDQTTTDERGRFEFHAIPTGIYIITAHFAGYRDLSSQADLRYSRSLVTQLQMERLPEADSRSTPPGGTVRAASVKVPSSRDANKALTDGQRLLFEKKDAATSIAKFKRVIELEPDYVPAYVLLGTAFTATGDWKQAETAFEEAIKRDPADASAWLGAGATLNQQHRYPEAEEKLRKCNELNANLPESHYELARALWATGRWPDAEPSVRRALELDRNHVLAHALLGNILLRKNDTAGAISEFNECLRLQPNGPAADEVRRVVANLKAAKQ